MSNSWNEITLINLARISQFLVIFNFFMALIYKYLREILQFLHLCKYCIYMDCNLTSSQAEAAM